MKSRIPIGVFFILGIVFILGYIFSFISYFEFIVMANLSAFGMFLCIIQKVIDQKEKRK